MHFMLDVRDPDLNTNILTPPIQSQQLDRAIAAAEKGLPEPTFTQGPETQAQEDIISNVMNDLDLQQAATSRAGPQKSTRMTKRKSPPNDEVNTVCLARNSG